MRESNFAFPAQNRACVCISSQLYDRRALDTNSPLPLFNSLTHLTYLTSTSPRIREIMTFDGGLERLVALLREFCLSPPPPENPALLYGLQPASSRPPRRPPLLNPTAFDKHAAYRFSLAFQSVVNIGVRGSEEIRARVVQAGTLDVVGCVLEAWLTAKGFAVGPSASASGLPRETREQRAARRQAQAELRNRQQALELERALRRQLEVTRQEAQQRQQAARAIAQSPASETPTDTSTNATPGASTPTGAVTVPGRERSGTVIGRPVWDGNTTVRARRAPATGPPSNDHSGDTSRAETETEDDADGDVDMEHAARPRTHSRRVVGIVSDNTENEGTLSPAAAAVPAVSDAHIIVDPTMVTGDGVGVEDGLVSLEQNDDFALGAPPGAPGAIDGQTPRNATARVGRMAPDITPRAIPVPLPGATAPGGTGRVENPPTLRPPLRALPTPATLALAHPNHHRDVLTADTGLYRDEDVLLGLQLLAYLSKYPHVRQAFYQQRPTFHPATAAAAAAQRNQIQAQQAVAGPSSSVGLVSPPARQEAGGFFKAFGAVRGKEKTKAAGAVANTSVAGVATGPSTSPTSAQSQQAQGSPAQRQTNVFSLVERFTFRPSSSESELPNAPPPLPADIQYWAGVIMRNACRKDDSRGGIRQCANMLCGKWESFPREFAKCRRCRKAKYCGKECQSTAWSEGHRFWCSAKDNDDGDGEHGRTRAAAGRAADVNAAEVASVNGPEDAPAPPDRRVDRERTIRDRTAGVAGGAGGPIPRGAIPAVEAARAINALYRQPQRAPADGVAEDPADENTAPAGAGGGPAWPWTNTVAARHTMVALAGPGQRGGTPAPAPTAVDDMFLDPLALEHPADMFLGGPMPGDDTIGIPIGTRGTEDADDARAGAVPVFGGDTGTVRARRGAGTRMGENAMVLD